jgi:hypothetical protein
MSDTFGLAPIKREGGVADPDDFTWECDLDKCEKCRAKYNNWKQKYREDQERYLKGGE